MLSGHLSFLQIEGEEFSIRGSEVDREVLIKVRYHVMAVDFEMGRFVRRWQEAIHLIRTVSHRCVLGGTQGVLCRKDVLAGIMVDVYAIVGRHSTN